MKKLDNFLNCLKVLEKADFSLAENDEIYRTGIIGQFNLTFELAWKALQQVLRLHGVQDVVVDARGVQKGLPLAVRLASIDRLVVRERIC